MTGAGGAGRVVVVGSLNLDTVLEVERIPSPGETVPSRGGAFMPGGKGGNQAAAAAAAGASTRIVAAVGADGERYLRHLAAAGVDTSAVTRLPDSPTGAATVIVDAAGENVIVVTEGANGRVPSARVAAEEWTAADVVLVQFEIPAEVVRAAAERARATGATLVVNPSPWRDDLSDVLAQAHVVIVNEHERRQLGEDVADDRVCTTLGGEGARWGSHTATPQPITPIDTAGAGDAFAGTLAAALVRGLSRGEALQHAVDAATAACLRRGAQQWRADGGGALR
ncbi:PfkB family carbohydrate kinase [Microbacterium sp. SSW1-59]|uniref:PfkB family carbohydrate kinase n=1 Tax=Microbacterium xanthum TaxID=3079794 RepID=UPI002AD30FAE|nr:PfkB family carbohydrate kinase [Microbacterium sp. SSW1-59]MDZ8201192.1 PfkB family carbohydrate kinase [Microbacterium sp. SSW1-59]